MPEREKGDSRRLAKSLLWRWLRENPPVRLPGESEAGQARQMSWRNNNSNKTNNGDDGQRRRKRKGWTTSRVADSFDSPATKPTTGFICLDWHSRTPTDSAYHLRAIFPISIRFKNRERERKREDYARKKKATLWNGRRRRGGGGVGMEYDNADV